MRHDPVGMMHSSAGRYKLGFGKYKGYTLAEIAQKDISYLSWLAGTQGDNAEIARAALSGQPLPENLT